jgi:hypothetical protein
VKNLPQRRRDAADQIGYRLIAAELVAPGARPHVVVVAPQHGDYIAVNAPPGSSEQAWREVLDALPWCVRIELAHSGSQGLTFRVHPATVAKP